MCLCLSEFIYTANMQKPMEAKRESDLLGSELQMFVNQLWALGTELRSSAVSTFNQGAISHACVHSCVGAFLSVSLRECRHR